MTTSLYGDLPPWFLPRRRNQVAQIEDVTSALPRPHISWPRTATLLVLVLGACRAVGSETTAPGTGWTDFIRVHDQGTARRVIATCVRRYLEPRNGQKLVVIPVVHVGSAEYYQSFEAELANASVVLSEVWIGANTPRTPEAGLPERLRWIMRSANASFNLLVARSGLTHQSEWEDALADDRWRRADLPPAAMKQYFSSSAVSVAPDVKRRIEIAERCVEFKETSSVECELAVRSAFRRIFAAAESPRKNRSYFFAVREAYMFDVLQRALAQGDGMIALIVGAEHAWALEPRLMRELGFQRQSARWVTAISVERAMLADESTVPSKPAVNR